MTRQLRAHRRAMVTAMAVTLMVLVGVALAALTAKLSTTARQTTTAREQAQLEELLLAGLTAARADPTPRTLDLPPILKESSASLKLTPHGNRIEIEAVLSHTRTAQEIELTPNHLKLLAPPSAQ